MTIRNRTKVPRPQEFRAEISKCRGDIGKIAKVVQRALMIDGTPGFAQFCVGSRGECPLPDKCTIMLLKGSIRLDDEKEDITERFVGLQTEGSKILRVKSNSTVVWLPSVCCWNSSECPLARRGQCRRVPGVVIPRDRRKPKLWWERFASNRKPVGI